jgi:hypothetical protein
VRAGVCLAATCLVALTVVLPLVHVFVLPKPPVVPDVSMVGWCCTCSSSCTTVGQKALEDRL